MRRVFPPVWMTLWGVTQLVATRLSGGRRRFGGQGLAAGALAAGGVTVAALALRRFDEAETTIHPDDPTKSTALVTSGVYQVTRNPMYVGMCLLLAGHAVWTGRARSLLAIPGFMACVTPQIEAEEAALTDLFGADYERYLKAVPRWLLQAFPNLEDHRGSVSTS